MKNQYPSYFGEITVIEKVLEYLNTGRGEEMTEEMYRCSYAQSLFAGKQTMELNSQYHTPEEIVRIMSEITGEELDFINAIKQLFNVKI